MAKVHLQCPKRVSTIILFPWFSSLELVLGSWYFDIYNYHIIHVQFKQSNNMNHVIQRDPRVQLEQIGYNLTFISTHLYEHQKILILINPRNEGKKKKNWHILINQTDIILNKAKNNT